jgi:hypothetical protein
MVELPAVEAELLPDEMAEAVRDFLVARNGSLTAV